MSRKQGSETIFDVIVIGGGPSGMMAAGRAAMRGKRVLLIEKNPVLGKKLSITGGGRCNVTNAEFDLRTMLAHYGEAAPFLFSPFSQFGVQDTFDFFAAHKLPLIVEDRKRAFPKTQSARDVTRVMERFVSKPTITIMLGTAVRGFIMERGVIVGVDTSHGVFSGNAFILATGGFAHAETGSTGEGVQWMSKLGHTTYAPNPDIVPLVVQDPWVKKLSGKSLERMTVTFSQDGARVVKTGKILFTHFGISGPLILNAVREIKVMLQNGHVNATIDLFPDQNTGELREHVLRYFESHKNQMLRNAVHALVPAGMTDAVLSHVPEPLYENKVHSISKEERHALVDVLKALSFTVTSTMGYDWAVVSDGGIDLREIDMKTMASQKIPNLFLTGDVLHINRPSGGFSLQLCWTTGWVAGSHV